MPKSTQQRIIDTKPAGRKATAFAAAATGSGTPVPTHALNGAYHTGTLDDAQAPQFLKTDGSRALTGNLSVSSGVTIDGVDLSAHVADLAAHHAAFIGLEDDTGAAVTPAADYRIQVLGGDGLASTAGSNTLTLAVDSTVVRTSRQVIAGSGLTGGGALSADVTLNVNPGAGVEIVSDAVRVDEDYAFSWTAQHAFAAGLSSSGDVIALQDLYVGGSTPSSATLFVDSSIQSVGINRQPDSQFALDVSGAARADWFVGPHALQLDDAEMIVHFDGPRPYETDFSGTAVGHMGQVPTEYGGIIYRPGKFGKAVQIAESTTNLVTNPSFEVDLSGWSSNSSDGSESISRDATRSVYGSACLRLDRGSSTWCYVNSNTFTVADGEWVTVSAYVHQPNGDAHVSIYEGSTKLAEVTLGGATTDFELVSVSYQNTSGASKTVNARIGLLSTHTGTTLYIDAVQGELKAYPTPYCDGSLGTGHSWSGTAHASTSTRSVSSMRWNWSDLTEDTPWTVMVWVRDPYTNWDYSSRSVASHIWSLRCNGDTDSADLYCSTATPQALTIRWRYGGSVVYPGITMPADDQWHHVAVSYDPSTQTLSRYVDGVLFGSPYTATKWSGNDGAGRIQLGMAAWSSSASDTYPPASILVDDFVMLNRVASDDEIRAIYESNAPVFAESSVFSWRAPSASPVWVDEEGLWVRTSDSVDVFGVYAGGATKTWGGLTLTAGDVLIGNNTDGYVWFDKDSVDATKLKIKSEVDIEGTSTVIGNLTVSGDILVTTGKISAGNGYVYMDSQGISIQADSDAGTGSVPVFDPEYGIEWYGVVATKSTHIGGIYGYGGSGFLKGLWIQSQPSYDIMMNPGSGGTVVIDGNCNVASNLTVDNNLTVSGSTATINAAVSISDTVYVSGNMEAAAEFAASGNVALLTSSYPSDAFKGIYINNGSESYTSWHIVEDGWGASHMIGFGARYKSGATGTPETTSNWITEFDAGGSYFGPSLFQYWGNGDGRGFRFFIGATSTGAGSTPSWTEKFRLRYDNAHAIYGNLTISGNSTVSGTLSVTGAVTLSNTLSVTGAATLNSTLTVTGTSNGGAISTGTLDTSVKHADINTVTGTVEKRANIVTVQLEATNRGGPNYWPSPGGTICRLPSGFRPSQELDVIVHDMVIAMRVVIYTDGYVKIEQQQASSSAGLTMWMTVSFVAA